MNYKLLVVSKYTGNPGVKVDKGVKVPQFETTLPITVSNHPSNKDSWRNLTNNLKHRCRDFVKNVTKS